MQSKTPSTTRATAHAVMLYMYILALHASTFTPVNATSLCPSAQDGSRSFTSSFFPTVFEDDGTSGSFSPTSLRQAFFMIGQGAGEADASEIHSALSTCPADDDTTIVGFAEFGNVAKALETSSDLLSVSIANGVSVDESFKLREEYADALDESWGAIATNVDFRNAVGDAKDAINSFVSENTNGLIPDILTEDPSADTVLFLVNTLYFKAQWVNPFGEAYPQKFSDPARGVSAWAQSMTNTFRVSLVEDGGTYSAISLPYLPIESGYEMLIIKPGGCKVEGENRTANLADVVAGPCLDALLEDAINKTSSMDSMQRTTVTIPRFHVKWRADEKIKKSLQSLGLRRIFSASEAELSGISANPGDELFVSQVAHQVDVKVNEQGTEAAAATAAGYTLLQAPKSYFRADEPFIYSIIHRPTGSILFAGWVNMDALEIDGPMLSMEESEEMPTCSSSGPTCTVEEDVVGSPINTTDIGVEQNEKVDESFIGVDTSSAAIKAIVCSASTLVFLLGVFVLEKI